MRAFSALAVLSGIVLSFSELVSASSHNIGQRRRHTFNASTGHNTRRANSGAFTWYAAGLGACGKTNSASDFIVALNQPQFNGGSHCFNMITITIGGKSTQAQIVDECMGCGENDLDFSAGLFSFFASLDVGELYGSWEYGSGAPASSTSPTSTWVPPSTTSHTPTSTSSSWSSSSTWSSTPTTTTTTSSSSASPTPTIPSGFIDQLNLALGQIGELIVAGAGVA